LRKLVVDQTHQQRRCEDAKHGRLIGTVVDHQREPLVELDALGLDLAARSEGGRQLVQEPDPAVGQLHGVNAGNGADLQA
jgi:hypothetical protein